MSESAKKEGIPRKGATRPSNGKKQTPPVDDQQNDSEDIERAVYDGMQDLRTKKSK